MGRSVSTSVGGSIIKEQCKWPRRLRNDPTIPGEGLVLWTTYPPPPPPPPTDTSWPPVPPLTLATTTLRWPEGSGSPQTCGKVIADLWWSDPWLWYSDRWVLGVEWSTTSRSGSDWRLSGWSDRRHLGVEWSMNSWTLVDDLWKNDRWL